MLNFPKKFHKTYKNTMEYKTFHNTVVPVTLFLYFFHFTTNIAQNSQNYFSLGNIYDSDIF